MKIWKALFYFLAIIPLAFIVLLMAFYFNAAQVHGHTPSYNNPDPKELDIYKAYAPYIDWTAEAFLYSLLVWFALTIIYLITMRRRIEWTPLIISGTGHVFGLLLLLSGIFEWYID